MSDTLEEFIGEGPLTPEEPLDEPCLEDAITVTPTEVLEHLFCPRFTYFMSVLSIPQREEKRYKVQMGREVHHQKQKHNRAYLRKKLGVIKREFGVYLSAPKYHLRGQVDEVLTLSDGTMAPLDYKFAEWKGRVYKGYRMQLVLYGLLIRENYPEARGVKKGFLVYTRSNNFIKEISIYEKDFQSAIRILQEIIEVVQNGKLPRRTRSKRRCMDCCYKNICV